MTYLQGKKTKLLLNAIAAGNLGKIQELIQTGVDVNQVDMANDDFTPLMLAISIERIDIVKLLIDAGADLYDSTYFEENPLGLAATKGNLEIVKLLLQAGADPDLGRLDAPICEAILQEHIDMVKTLIKWNANVNSCSESGITALMMAAITGNIKIVEMLLEEGADPDASDGNGCMALDKAAYYGHQDIFDYLLLFTSSLEHQREYLQKELAIGILRKQRKDKYRNRTTDV